MSKTALASSLGLSTFGLRKASLASLLLLAACGGAADPPPAHPEAPSAEVEELQADSPIVPEKLAEARAALEEGAPRKARRLAEEARRAAGQAQLRDVRAVVDEIDAYEARDIAVEVRQLAAGRQCPEAFETVAATLSRTPPPGRVLVSTLHDETEAALVACLRVDMDEALAQQDFAKARAVLEMPKVAVALRDEAWKSLADTLQGGIATSIVDELRADIAAGRYEEAAQRLEAAKQVGSLGGEGRGVVEQFQKLFEKPLLEKAEGILAQGKGDPGAALDEIDAVARLFEWELPKDLAVSRQALAIFAECRRLQCTFPNKPEQRFTYGKVEIAPPHDSSEAPVETVPSARKIHVVARGRSLSLVTHEEPSANLSLKDRLLGAKGWAAGHQLKAEDTIDWLLPGDELVGQRVFGPLREKDRNYYLGIVTAVDGNSVSVKRLSDESEVTVPRSSLRSGRLPAGTKVLAYCSNPLKMEPAVVDAEVSQPTGLPLVRIACPAEKGTAGPVREEVLGAIVSKPEWLPRRRP